MKIKALHKKVLVRVTDKENNSGILIPDSAKEKQGRGEIVSAGSGLEDLDFLHFGSTVIFNKHSGVELEEDGKKFLLLREEELLAVLENN